VISVAPVVLMCLLVSGCFKVNAKQRNQISSEPRSEVDDLFKKMKSFQLFRLCGVQKWSTFVINHLTRRELFYATVLLHLLLVYCIIPYSIIELVLYNLYTLVSIMCCS